MSREEEAGFIEALKRSDAVDLVSWATTLIEIGLARLEVGAEATALLTGGSCSWKWFQERVRAHSLFKVSRNSRCCATRGPS